MPFEYHDEPNETSLFGIALGPGGEKPASDLIELLAALRAPGELTSAEVTLVPLEIEGHRAWGIAIGNMLHEGSGIMGLAFATIPRALAVKVDLPGFTHITVGEVGHG